jgi:hypothetical protein
MATIAHLQGAQPLPSSQSDMKEIISGAREVISDKRKHLGFMTSESGLKQYVYN